MSNWCTVVVACSVALSLAAAAPAQEQTGDSGAEAGAETDEDKALVGAGTVGYDPETAFFGPLPRYVSPEGNVSAGMGMFMQIDGGTWDRPMPPDGEDDGGLIGRRAVVLANALFYRDYILFGTFDFFDTGEGVLDGLRSAMFAYRRFDPLWFMVGQQLAGHSMDAGRGLRAFIEEAMSSGAFNYAPSTPMLGASVAHRGPNHSARFGVFSVPFKEIGSGREGWGVHGRLTYAPIVERTRALHFGVAGYWRRPSVEWGAASGSERFSSRPELRIPDDRAVVDTGDIERVDSFHYGGLELAGVWGPWSVQGEVQRVGIVRDNGTGGQPWPDLEFNGWYVLGTWFLTGESRNYYQRLGSFWRVKPHREFDPFGDGGWGAFEVAARLSHIDLDDEIGSPGGVAGGASDNLTLGLNWYFDPYVRLSLNYIRAEVDGRDEEGRLQPETMDGVGVRLRWEF